MSNQTANIGNFIGELRAPIPFGKVHNRAVGSKILIRIFPNGSVLLFAPSEGAWRASNFKPAFVYQCKDIEEARKYATCTRRTNYDVEAAWKAEPNYLAI